MKLTASASKPKRIITNTATTLKIEVLTKPVCSVLVKAVNKTAHATAAAHCLRSRTRKRNRTNRAANQAKGANMNHWATFAAMIRAPRNPDSGPEDGCGGG